MYYVNSVDATEEVPRSNALLNRVDMETAVCVLALISVLAPFVCYATMFVISLIKETGTTTSFPHKHDISHV
uniref:Col_cuticle_N domain-containing protein n=1 Tax=Steinernema glaseri TaxID=37863 RepID=A0A1I7ZDK3_9BILA